MTTYDYPIASPAEHKAEMIRRRDAHRAEVEAFVAALDLPEGWRIDCRPQRRFLTRYQWAVVLWHGDREVEGLATYDPMALIDRMAADARAQARWEADEELLLVVLDSRGWVLSMEQKP